MHFAGNVKFLQFLQFYNFTSAFLTACQWDYEKRTDRCVEKSMRDGDGRLSRVTLRFGGGKEMTQGDNNKSNSPDLMVLSFKIMRWWRRAKDISRRFLGWLRWLKLISVVIFMARFHHWSFPLSNVNRKSFLLSLFAT